MIERDFAYMELENDFCYVTLFMQGVVYFMKKSSNSDMKLL